MADIIDQLSGMDDAALSAKLGLDQKIADARRHLGELAALSGEARKIAADRIQHQFTPNVWTDEWGHIARDAQRQADAKKIKSAKDIMEDGSPSSLGV